MTDEPASAQVRGKCVRWLSGQCHGGRECVCVPWPRPIAEPEGGEGDGGRAG